MLSNERASVAPDACFAKAGKVRIRQRKPGGKICKGKPHNTDARVSFASSLAFSTDCGTHVLSRMPQEERAHSVMVMGGRVEEVGAQSGVEGGGEEEDDGLLCQTGRYLQYFRGSAASRLFTWVLE